MPSWIDRDKAKVSKQAERRAQVEAWMERALSDASGEASFWGRDKPSVGNERADPAVIAALSGASKTEPRQIDYEVTRKARRAGWLKPVYRDDKSWGCKLWVGDVLTALGAAYLARWR